MKTSETNDHRSPIPMSFSEVPMDHFFTPGWRTLKKTSDRVAVQVSGLFDGAGEYHHFAPDDKVYSWGSEPPWESDRLAFWTDVNLSHVLLSGFDVDLSLTPKPRGQRTPGNFHIPNPEGK